MLSLSTINKVILLGKIVKEPRWHAELGEKVLCFTIVTTEKVRRNADHVEHTEYHDIRVNSYIIDDIQLLTGQHVYIQGKIQTKQFVDAEQIRRYKTEVLSSSVEIIGTPQN